MGILSITMKYGLKFVSKGASKLGIKSLFKTSSKSSVFNLSSKGEEIFQMYINQAKSTVDNAELVIPKRGTKELEKFRQMAKKLTGPQFNVPPDLKYPAGYNSWSIEQQNAWLEKNGFRIC